MKHSLLLILVGIITFQRLFEIVISARNRRFILNKGGKEFGSRHYPLFFILHIGWIVGWVSETYLRNRELDHFWPVWMAILILAQSLRFLSMWSLGRFWNTRILIIPGWKKINTGVYHYLSNPNYLAVILEIAAAPLIFHAWTTAVLVSTFNFILLVFIRIPAEKKALKLMRP